MCTILPLPYYKSGSKGWPKSVFALEMKKLEPRKAKGHAQGHMATSRHVGDRSPEVLPPGTPLRGVWKVTVNHHLSTLHDPLLAKGRAWL